VSQTNPGVWEPPTSATQLAKFGELEEGTVFLIPGKLKSYHGEPLREVPLYLKTGPKRCRVFGRRTFHDYDPEHPVVLIMFNSKLDDGVVADDWRPAYEERLKKQLREEWDRLAGIKPEGSSGPAPASGPSSPGGRTPS
jgi:hypothetical protein